MRSGAFFFSRFIFSFVFVLLEGEGFWGAFVGFSFFGERDGALFFFVFFLRERKRLIGFFCFFYILFLFGFALAHSDLRLAPCHSTPRRDSTYDSPDSPRLDSTRLSTSTLNARFATRLASACDWRLAHSTYGSTLDPPLTGPRRAISFFGHYTHHVCTRRGAIDALWTG